MKTIRIISGAYGADNGRHGVTVIQRGETCQVDDAEAARLIAIGVAADVVITASDAANIVSASDDMSENTTAQNGTVGTLDKEQLETMTNADLKKLAEDMGLDTGKCKKKADYVVLITSAEVSAPSADDLPPELSPEVPEL